MTFGDTLAKWGIDVQVKGKRELVGEGPLPGGLEISGFIKSDNKLDLHVQTKIGEGHAFSFNFGGKFEIGEDGSTKSANCSFFVAGTGMSGELSDNEAGARTYKSTYQEGMYEVGIQSGDDNKGPLSVGFTFGPLEVKIDPSKYWRRLKEKGPELLDLAHQKIGGVSLAVDGEAMAYALAGAESPPPEFGQSQIAVSLNSLLNEKAVSLGDLNQIDGAMLDSSRHDLFIVGHHKNGVPEIPLERMATLERTIYESDLHPFISIDPQGFDFSKPHKPRIGGIAEDLRDSSLIQTMLTADYSMKRIVVADRHLESVPSLMDVAKKYEEVFPASRLWINPAPLQIGDITVQKTDQKRLYTIRSKPLVLTAPLVPHSSSEESTKESAPNAPGELAQLLTRGYEAVAKEWPESGFYEAEQDLQLSNLFCLLKSAETENWTKELLGSLGKAAIPHVQIPDSFPGLSTNEEVVAGRTLKIEGGMTTDVTIPTKIIEDPSTSLMSTDWSGARVGLSESLPQLREPAASASDLSAARLKELGYLEVASGLYKAALEDARESLAISGKDEDAEYLLILALAGTAGDQDPNFDTKFSAEIDSALTAYPKSARLWTAKALYKINASYRVILGDPQQFRYEARSACSEAIKADSNFAPAYALRAKLEDGEQMVNDWLEKRDEEVLPRQDDDALADFDQAVKLSPLSSTYLIGRASVKYAMKKQDAAIADLNQAISISPRGNLASLFLTMVLQKAKRLPEAIAAARSATLCNPADWRCFRLLGLLSYEAQDFEGAVKALDSALAIWRSKPYDAILHWGGLTPFGTDPDPYPTTPKLPDLWKDFIYRCGEPLPQVGLGATIDGLTVEFDPEMLLRRGQAHYHLQHWKEALADLREAAHYRSSFETAMVKDLDTLIKECESHNG